MNNNKNILLSMGIIAVAITSSCTNKVKECASLLASIKVTDSVYYNSQTEANCKAYKSAMNAWINKTTCSNLDAVKKAELQVQISALNCP